MKEDLDWLIEKGNMPYFALTLGLRGVGLRGGGGEEEDHKIYM